MRIAISTLGCKINQFETDVMRQGFQARGGTLVPFEEDADVYIINTCTVTSKSDIQCRQMIRAAAQRNSNARIVVTGCYAETRPEEVGRLPGVSLVCGNRDKALLVDKVLSLFPHQHETGNHLHRTDEVPSRAVKSRTRGFLKIQDGCNSRCSYCIVPAARGGSKSAAPAEVVMEFEKLVQAGCPEVVLTGIHIGTYGCDLDEPATLTDLVRRLLALRKSTRIRLSSIEPREVTDELTGFLGNGLCRHLHIPLQSGDDFILASMKRNYTSRYYSDLLANIAKINPFTAFGADVMVGFPGEGEQEFRNSLHLIEQSPLTHLHVFRYSPRPGTPAADMKHQVSVKTKKERNEELRKLGLTKNLEFRKRNLGSEHTVVVEAKIDSINGMLTGLTDNYIRVHITGAKTEDIGRPVNVTITEVKNDITVAVINNVL